MTLPDIYRLSTKPTSSSLLIARFTACLEMETVWAIWMGQMDEKFSASIVARIANSTRSVSPVSTLVVASREKLSFQSTSLTPKGQSFHDTPGREANQTQGSHAYERAALEKRQGNPCARGCPSPLRSSPSPAAPPFLLTRLALFCK